jgi:hypothetical protein
MAGLSTIGALGCASAGSRQTESALSATAPGGTVARVYYWRARPGKLEEYNRYIRQVAEPIDREAQKRGAFLSVTTYVNRDSAAPWTHMRVFVLRDSLQLGRLSAQLDSAGIRLEPDSARRRSRAEYAATLRDRAGDTTLEVLR